MPSMRSELDYFRGVGVLLAGQPRPQAPGCHRVFFLHYSRTPPLQSATRLSPDLWRAPAPVHRAEQGPTLGTERAHVGFAGSGRCRRCS